jgi:hypothetical protein
MLRIRDYTRLSVGALFEGNKIVACDHCGKPALLEESNGKKWFTHSDTVGFDSDGEPVMLWVSCPPLAPKTTPE